MRHYMQRAETRTTIIIYDLAHAITAKVVARSTILRLWWIIIIFFVLSVSKWANLSYGRWNILRQMQNNFDYACQMPYWCHNHRDALVFLAKNVNHEVTWRLLLYIYIYIFFSKHSLNEAHIFYSRYAYAYIGTIQTAWRKRKHTYDSGETTLDGGSTLICAWRAFSLFGPMSIGKSYIMQMCISVWYKTSL